MTAPPKLRLSRLRDIGWLLWDPIGLLVPGRRWDDDASQAFADEYDGYLIEAAGMLRRGTPDRDVIKLLVTAETVHIGLTERADTRERARLTVAAIKADKDLWIYSE